MALSAFIGVLVALVNVSLALISLQLNDSEEFVVHTWKRLKNKILEKMISVVTLQVCVRMCLVCVCVCRQYGVFSPCGCA